MPLTDIAIKRLKHNGEANGLKHSDGGGLYLHVKEAGKYWRMAYRYAGAQKVLSFGVYPLISLADARQMRDEAKRAIALGQDPQENKRAKKQQQVEAGKNTFKAVASEWHAMKAKMQAKSTSDKQWAQLQKDVFPELGDRPIHSITPQEMIRVLRRASERVPYTATRLREMSGQIFRLAIATGRTDINPASELRGLITAPPVQHHPALTTRAEFGQFVRDLYAFERCYPVTKLGALLALLTWTRPGELRLSRPGDIDLDRKEWRVPAQHMKRGKQLQAFTVPLSKQALLIVEHLMQMTQGTGRMLPGVRGADGVISENTINGMFKKMGYQNKQTHHGLRASARSLLSERGWSAPALERQLDHAEANKVIAAYSRSEYLDERKRFMTDWGNLIDELRGFDPEDKDVKFM